MIDSDRLHSSSYLIIVMPRRDHVLTHGNIFCSEILPIPPKKVNTVIVELYNEVEKDRYNEMTRSSMETFKVCNFQRWSIVKCRKLKIVNPKPD